MKLPKSITKIDPVYLWLAVILVVAAFMRFYHYASFSFSNDELSAINRLRFNSFHELVDKGFYVDGHPGGIQVMLWYWIKLFGISEASLRFPFVIFGILAVLFAFLVGRQLFGVVAGLFSSAAVAFLEFPLLYSQIARPYGAGVFFCLLNAWFWFRVVDSQYYETRKRATRIVDLAGYTVSAALCMYNHYFSFLLAAIIGFTGLFLVKRRMLAGYIMAGATACLLFLPHLYITLNHLTYKGVGLWLGKPTPAWIAEHILFIFNHQAWILIVTLVVAATLAWVNRKHLVHNKYRFVVLLFFLLPMAIGYIYSVRVNPVLQHPVLIFSFVFLLFFLFSFGGDRLKPVHSAILAVFLIAGVYSTAGYGNYYHKQHFGEFRDVAKQILTVGAKYGKQNVTNIVSANNPYYITYYFDKQDDSALLSMTNVTNDSLKSLGQKVRNCGTPYLLYAWTKPSPAEAEDIIEALYPYRLLDIDYGGLSELYVFSKTRPENYSEKEKTIAERQMTFEENPLPIPQENLSKGFAYSGANSMKVDSAIEYSPGLVIEPGNTEGFTGECKAVAEAWVWFDREPKEAILVLSLEVPGKEPLIWKGAVISNYASAGNWYRVLQTVIIPEKTDANAVIKAYIWNKGREHFFVDEMKLSLKQLDFQQSESIN
ncbi:MAG TPA: glycosyltransferase family 39 protein [Bacteroidales bacterium]|nr:glycosyltransferase family 39 protein [Bacteroidales bacterium]